jgi:hypothetical protein
VLLDKLLRTAAILVVKKWIPGDASYCIDTEQFATQCLEDLIQLASSVTPTLKDTSEVAPEMTLEDEITHRLELYLALSSKKPEMFYK